MLCFTSCLPSGFMRIFLPTISLGKTKSSRMASCTAVRVRLKEHSDKGEKLSNVCPPGNPRGTSASQTLSGTLQVPEATAARASILPSHLSQQSRGHEERETHATISPQNPACCEPHTPAVTSDRPQKRRLVMTYSWTHL